MLYRHEVDTHFFAFIFIYSYCGYLYRILTKYINYDRMFLLFNSDLYIHLLIYLEMKLKTIKNSNTGILNTSLDHLKVIICSN